MSDFDQKLLGSWALVRAERSGEPMPPEAAAQVQIEFDAAGRYRVRFAGELTDEGRFTLRAAAPTSANGGADSGGAPLQITLLGETGTNAQRKLPGIIQLRGNRLRLCLALEGRDAPHAFSSKAGTAHYLATWKRKAH